MAIEGKKSIHITESGIVSRVQRYADEIGSKTLTRHTIELASAELSRIEAGVSVRELIAQRDQARQELAELKSKLARMTEVVV